MKTDLPLKLLFQQRAADLLVLTGDEGAVVESVAPVEVPVRELRVDTVMRLRHGAETYFRHVEFQARHRRGIEWRFFDYNTQLTLRLRRPVFTTVLWLLSPGPPGESAFRLAARGREAHAWHYESVCVGRLPASLALSGGPGLAALTPLFAEGGERDAVVRAARRIEATLPAQEQPEMLALLSAFLGRRYTVEEIVSLVGRRTMIESNFWDAAVKQGRQRGMEEGRQVGLQKGLQEGLQQGLQQGRTAGQLEEDRRLCLDMVRAYHRGLLPRLEARIRECAAASRLRTWILRAPRLSEAEFARLVLGPTR